MRYQLPQFIEMEDKIIGPFSLKQFIYLISVPAVCYVLHFFVRLPFVILVGIIFFPVAILLAFYKVNGRPFSQAILGFLRYVRRPQIYTWKRISKPQKNILPIDPKIKTKQRQKITSSKKEKDFKKLAEILDRGND